jgi:hypothetical protein
MLDHRTGAPRGGFVLSLDLELMWGVRDKKTVASYGANILGVRQAVPRLLDLFARNKLACTWATVGMLFFDNRDALIAALPEERPAYDNPRLSPYGDIARIGASEAEDPHHYALSLIRRIAEAPHQEIATHTFSHFYCLEPGQTVTEFRADLAAACNAAKAIGITLESIVFPRNQFNAGYLDTCRKAGLIAYRGQERSRIYAAGGHNRETLLKRGARLMDAYLNLSGPHGDEPVARDGVVDVPSSRFLRPWSGGLAAFEPLRLNRVLKAMRRAAARGEVFHLWFHPHNFGVNQNQNFAVMERIATEAGRLRDHHGWPSLTMAEVARRALAA